MIMEMRLMTDDGKETLERRQIYIPIEHVQGQLECMRAAMDGWMRFWLERAAKQEEKEK